MQLLFEWISVLGEMKGPNFLTFYFIIFLIIFIGLYVLYDHLDPTGNMAPYDPVERKPDIYEFAVLRKGRFELVRILLFELISSQLIEQRKDRNGKVIRCSGFIRTDKAVEDVPDLSPEAKAVLPWFEIERDPGSVFKKSPLESFAKVKSEEYGKIFEEKRLILSQKSFRLANRVKKLGISLFVLLGISKLFYASLTGHTNVNFLIIFLVYGFLLWVSVTNYG